MSKGKGPIRRSQLITTFGVGAMHTLRNGISVVTAGLDQWYKKESGSSEGELQIDEYKFNEWRLQDLLMVDHFREPPDYRPNYRFAQGEARNRELFIPHLRFPSWYRCRICSGLTELSLTMSDEDPKCSLKRKNKDGKLVDCNGRLQQVPVVAICSAGHMQDFPWAEWVHRSVAPECRGALKLKSLSGSSLTGMIVKCGICKRERTLANILKEGLITKSLTTSDTGTSGTRYPCQGGRPWLGIREEGSDACGEDLKGTLRTSSNVHFPSIRSSLRLPLERLSEKTSTWGRMGEDIYIGPYVSNLKSVMVNGIEPSYEASFIKAIREKDNNNILTTVDDSLIIEVFNMHCRGESMEEEQEVGDEDRDNRFRREEFNVLASGVKDEVLRSKRAKINEISLLAQNFEDIWLVDSLEEVRALIGFSRINSFGVGDLESMSRLMWKNRPNYRVRNWLPAYRVKGEGILFVFNEEKIRSMEQEPVFSDKVEVLNRRKDLRPFHERDLSTRLLVVHTFAHLIIRQLVFYCGYPAASLRERLYVSDDRENPIAAVMVYTASGDSQGTMGGLVKMGEPDNLVEPLNLAIENAKWCSSDPVCMEVGNQQGQGQYGLNLAACHDCCLLPNTSCEHFNNFLDRTFLIGDGSSVRGYFDR
jgi:hypothetical protein|tara:strand:+ start:1845 stop:3785 length:1941 start_codon:yes stop_codon:yes gene_type:complete